MPTDASSHAAVEDPDPGVIRLQVRELRQIFDTLDPAPFRERDLDERMAEYVESSAAELPKQIPLRLVVHLPREQIQPEQTELLQSAVHNHYENQVQQARRRFRLLLRDGRRTLWIGLLAMGACMLIADAASDSRWRTIQVLGEGLIIGGWVAMWRPIEILLYDWWPLRREIHQLERLRDLRVEVQAES